jgi:AmiR/NasT family two-component response regulator
VVVAWLRQRLRDAENRATNLERALISNRRIGMAIGVLLTQQLTEQQAFEALRQESMHRNVKLRDLAEEVIYTGALNGSARGRMGTPTDSPEAAADR